MRYMRWHSATHQYVWYARGRLFYARSDCDQTDVTVCGVKPYVLQMCARPDKIIRNIEIRWVSGVRFSHRRECLLKICSRLASRRWSVAVAPRWVNQKLAFPTSKPDGLASLPALPRHALRITATTLTQKKTLVHSVRRRCVSIIRRAASLFSNLISWHVCDIVKR